MTLYRDVNRTPHLPNRTGWVNCWTGEARDLGELTLTTEFLPVPDPPTWVYRRRSDGVGELVLPVPGIRGPFHTIAPAVSRMPDGLWRICPEVMAEAQRPWMRIYWGDPDGLDDFGIHVGNVAKESRGCILPGLSPTPTGNAESAAAMRIIMAVGRGIEGEQWLRVQTVGGVE